MKRIFLSVLSGVILLIFAASLIACSPSDELSTFEKDVSQSIAVSDSLDTIDENDLSETLLTDLSYTEYNPVYQKLSIGENATVFEKIQEVRSLHQAIVSIHAQNISDVYENKIKVATLKQSIDDFHRQSYHLSDEEITQLSAWKTELQSIKDTLQETIGKVYVPMRNLRGTYSTENLDNILAIYNDVLSELQTRQDCLQRISEIIENANQLISNYLE